MSQFPEIFDGILKRLPTCKAIAVVVVEGDYSVTTVADTGGIHNLALIGALDMAADRIKEQMNGTASPAKAG